MQVRVLLGALAEILDFTEFRVKLDKRQRTHYACESAGIAQMVEQAICNRHVRGSSPRIGSLSISTDSAMDNESETR